FCLNHTPSTKIYTLSLHDALPILRVDPGFLQPLLDGFGDNQVFAVSCQIFFSGPTRKREETGLTEGWWLQGGLRVRHREDPDIRSEEHTSELQSRFDLVCRLLLEK